MSDRIPCLTIRQPWAWAVFHGKDVENRSRKILSLSGPLVIHAGMRIDWEAIGGEDDRLYDLFVDRCEDWPGPYAIDTGVILGVVDVVGVHRCYRGCCGSPWADIGMLFHIRMANPRLLPEPVPWKGRQGVWYVDPATVPGLETLL